MFNATYADISRVSAVYVSQSTTSASGVQRTQSIYAVSATQSSARFSPQAQTLSQMSQLEDELNGLMGEEPQLTHQQMMDVHAIHEQLNTLFETQSPTAEQISVEEDLFAQLEGIFGPPPELTDEESARVEEIFDDLERLDALMEAFDGDSSFEDLLPQQAMMQGRQQADPLSFELATLLGPVPMMPFEIHDQIEGIYEQLQAMFGDLGLSEEDQSNVDGMFAQLLDLLAPPPIPDHVQARMTAIEDEINALMERVEVQEQRFETYDKSGLSV
uniref:Uncharacterized protein n=1 Tax=Magnetococcus massalia (strain MO-1) TaxID=451514 RepID=A0A1S7LNP6_MAGMO|nr:protein of unknown function. coiled-coil [Candidatus Magnetococcus massalia]